MKTEWLAAVLLAACFAQAEETRFDKLDRLFESGDRRYVFVVAHRGLPDAARGIPENSRAAIENAIAHGADIVEVDPKITVDRRIILMHDPSPAAVVYGPYPWGSVGQAPGAAWKGQLENCILKKSRTVDEPSGEHICLLEDALEAVRGKAFLWLDTNIWQLSGNLDDLFRIIQDKHMERQCLFAGDVKSLAGTNPRWIPKWVRFASASPRRESGTLDQNKPADFNDSSAMKDERFGWTRPLDEGATILMTDRPAELISYLDKRGRRKLEPESDSRRMVAPLEPKNVMVAGAAVCQGAADTADYRVVADPPSDKLGVRFVTLRLKDPKSTRWTDTTDGDKKVWYRAIDPNAKPVETLPNCRDFLARLAAAPDARSEVPFVKGADRIIRLVDEEGVVSYALAFTNSAKAATLKVEKPVWVEWMLLVGGGGGAGCSAHPGTWQFHMAGGGAGGSVHEAGRFTLKPGSYDIAVGAGGQGSSDLARPGARGGDSRFSGAGIQLKAAGGGGGGSASQAGGSGKGGAGANAGGKAVADGDNIMGGGGGGAGSAGGAGRLGRVGGPILSGGAGKPCAILGDTIFFGGGGAGGTHSVNGGGTFGNNATAGGGSNSCDTYAKPEDNKNFSLPGADGLGGGGAAGWAGPNAAQLHGSRGGDGVVILRVRKISEKR